MRAPPAVPSFRVLVGLACVSVATPLSAQDSAHTTPAVRRILVLPAFGSAPETGLQFGAVVLAVLQLAEAAAQRPSFVQASVVRTTRAQLRVSLDAERWSAQNTWRVALNSAWQRFPLPYYGYGDTTSDEMREVYTPQGIEATVTVQRRLVGAFYVLGASRITDNAIVRTDPDGLLHTGEIEGSRGGRAVEVSAGLLVDTRDHLFAPRRGTHAQLVASRADHALGSEFEFQRVRVDVRQYVHRGAHVLAMHALVHGVPRGAPFDLVPLLGGGDIMRGYAKGRYRDAWLTAAQVEYRSPFYRRFGAVGFAGAGTVAPTLSDIPDARLLPTVGVGLRAQLDTRQGTAVRVDYARGNGSASGLYIGFNQAF